MELSLSELDQVLCSEGSSHRLLGRGHADTFPDGGLENPRCHADRVPFCSEYQYSLKIDKYLNIISEMN